MLPQHSFPGLFSFFFLLAPLAFGKHHTISGTGCQKNLFMVIYITAAAYI